MLGYINNNARFAHVLFKTKFFRNNDKANLPIKITIFTKNNLFKWNYF